LSGSIPEELGNLANLTQLILSSNQFSGPLPQNLTNLDILEFFWFTQTDLCEPADIAFQAWLASIDNLQSTGVICNEAPVADAGGPYMGDVGEHISLDASGSFDPDGEIVLFEWDLDNDGEFDDATGPTTDVTFDSPGTFTIGLKVTDDEGGSSNDTADVTVRIGEGIVRVTFEFEGGDRLEPDGWEKPVIIKFLSGEEEVLVVEDDSTFDPVNALAFVDVVGLAQGTYDISVEGPSTLTNIREDVDITGLGDLVYLGVLLSGDVDGNGVVNISDFGRLAAAFLKVINDPEYDPATDFDMNGVTNISDFGLLAKNFLKFSPVRLTPIVTIQDSNGNEVVFEKPPERIVAYDSAAVETLFAMGEGQRIVATHSFVTYPPETENIPKVGSAFEINIEETVALEPDLVFIFFDRFLNDLKDAGMKVLYVRTLDQGFESIPDRIRTWGAIVGNQGAANSLSDEFGARVSQIREVMAQIELGPTVVQDAGGFWVPGPDTLVGEVFKLLKLQNIAHDVSGYAQLSPEDIVERNPEIILSINPEVFVGDPAFSTVSAVINGRVFPISNKLNIAGPRFVEGIEELAALVYPDLFASE